MDEFGSMSYSTTFFLNVFLRKLSLKHSTYPSTSQKWQQRANDGSRMGVLARTYDSRSDLDIAANIIEDPLGCIQERSFNHYQQVHFLN